MKDKVRVGLELAAIVGGFAAFAGVMYWLYLKEYDKTHPENISVEEIPETFRKTVTTEHRIVPPSFEKPAMESLVRDRQEQIDYSTISTQYTPTERIETETTQIVKEVRGGDSVRDVNEIEPVGDKKELLMDDELAEQQEVEIREDEELVFEDENGAERLVHKSIRNAPYGKSQAELAMRFSVINEFDFDSGEAFFEKHTAYYFPKDQIIAGFDDSMVEIDDPEMLDMAYMAIDVRGAKQLYVRDNDAGVDYHILMREGDYAAAYEDWVLSKSD